MAAPPGLRLARAAIFAAVCVTATATGHALTARSGDTPPAPAVVCAFATTTAGAWWLARRERGAVAVTGGTVLAQVVLHALFTLVHAPGQAARAAHAHHVHGAGGRLEAVPAGHGWSAGMVAAHALAALVCGLLLWRGEAAAFRIGRSLGGFLLAPLRRARRILDFAGAHDPRRSPVTCGQLPRPRGLSLRYAVLRRGPPGHPVCC